MVEGCLEWQDKGLNTPAIVRQEADKLFEDQDPLGEFIDTQCILHTSAEAESSWIYNAYKYWCGQQGREPAFRASQSFTRNLTARDGISTRKGTGGVRLLTGIKLLGDPDKPALSPVSGDSGAKTAISESSSENPPIGKVSENTSQSPLTPLASVEDSPEEGLVQWWEDEDGEAFQ